jgi:hypothetical protein
MFFEAYFVLDGYFTFVLDGRTTTHGPETFVLVPAGAAHTFGNTSDAPARLLVIHAPALDGYFAELEQLWAGDQAPTRAGTSIDEPPRDGAGPTSGRPFAVTSRLLTVSLVGLAACLRWARPRPWSLLATTAGAASCGLGGPRSRH